MLEDNKKEILENNEFLNKRKDFKRQKVFATNKKISFVIGLVLALATVLVLYFVSDYSKIYHISVEGNVYLNDEDIVKISELNENDNFLFVVPFLKEHKLLNSPYIEEAKIYKLDDNLIKIVVKEVKQIAYLNEDYESKILLQNGERITLDENNYYLINKLPLLEGYTKEQIVEILRGFKQVDYKIINEISEIHRYPFSYDENMLEVIMKDGNYCFVSWTGISMLEEYYKIVSAIDSSSGNACIYLDELTKSGYTSICPWQETNETITQETDE